VRHHKALAMNALNPDQMTAAERLAEIGDLLAAAFIRLQERKSRPLSGDRGESSLDCFAHQSGHAQPQAHGGSD
jgi:hypothetical protein